MRRVRRGFKCKREVIESLIREYDNIVSKDYNGNYLEVIYDFEDIAENRLKNLLWLFYTSRESLKAAWRPCKGELYEYAVFKYIQDMIKQDKELEQRFTVLMGDEALPTYGDQVAIRNWSEIFPDVDILIIEKCTGLVKMIASCKTSLRERLTETAFWKRELERQEATRGIKVVFITTDKDNELKKNTNRYMSLHVLDCTFVTDPQRYKNAIESFKSKYGDKEDFNTLRLKVRFIDDLADFLKELC